MDEAKQATLLRQLHLVGRIEGTSMLVLLGLAMPLKYFAGQPIAVTIIGALHGVLWIGYLLTLAVAWKALRWPFATAFLGGAASVLPFGPWWFESYTSKRTANVEA